MTPVEAQELLAQVEGMSPYYLQDHMDWKQVASALETIAGLRYEYAVQVLLSDGDGVGVWHFADEDSLPFGSLKPYEVRWYTEKEAQEILDAEVDYFGHDGIRIARRLAGDPEVVE